MLAVAAAALPQVVLAQDAQAPAAEDEGLGEIVVTATKRAEDSQKTATALQVFTPDQLKKNGINDVSGLTTVSPSLNIGASSGAAFLSIRGVASRDFTEIGDSAIAVSIDDQYLQRPTGINASFYDLERIEVLRGPQGTLYGRNATGGAVNIITKKPTDELEGYVSFDAGNYKTINADAAINLPITAGIAMRASAVSRYNDGFRDNGAVGRGDSTNVKGGRLSFLLTPTDRLKVLLSADYMHLGGSGAVYDGVKLTTVNGVITTVPKDDAYDATHWDLNTKGRFDTTNLRLLGRADYDLDFATVSYISGYMKQDLFHRWDNDGQADKFFIYTRDEKSEDVSQELRVASNNKSGFIWQFGLYYFNEDLKLANYFDNDISGAPVNLREYHYDVTTRSKAAFGQVSYDVLDNLRVSGGIRYTKDTKIRQGYSYVGSLTQDVSDGIAERTYATDDTRASWTKVTWHGGIDYTLSPENLLYAKVDSGYKSGGFNNFGLGDYDPETLVAYEIGSKNRFLDDKLQLNLSAFLYDYKDQQVSQVVGADTIVVNAGKSRIKGIEAETVAALFTGSRIDFSVTYLDAKYRDFCTNKTAAGVCTANYGGNFLVQSPKWSINAGIQQSFAALGGEFTARAQTQYRSEQWMSYFNRSTERQDAYTRTDLSLEYVPDDTNLSIQGYVRNLENSVVLTEAAQSGLYGAIRSQYAPPRTYGVRATFRW
ncbi:TonB-dependent receptor [Novosphingobium sp. 9U]|uniref:TonB-dependent receptor n=1 Tax=Novosphingobium sp. 9U TaxID=2653158 RepID=UPI0013598379|nr:TonB-dependent receptor [Novosphingobium sp. 9U]